MFYAQFVLSKKGPLAKIWLAAHWEKKLSKAQIYETNVQDAVDEILRPKVKMALRTTGHLLLGIVRIYSRKTKYLLADCNEAFLKIKMAFRPGQIDLIEEGKEAPLNTISLPEVYTDFDSTLPDFNEMEFVNHLQINQSRIDDITLKEDHISDQHIFGADFANDDFGDTGFGPITFGIDDDFGDFPPLAPLDDASSIEIQREASSFAVGDMRIGHRNFRETTPSLDGAKAPGVNIFVDDDFSGVDMGGGEDDLAGPIFHDIAGLQTDATSLENNDDLQLGAAANNLGGIPETQESFTLEPLEAGALDHQQERKRRKRRLIIDEQKNISGDEMKANMADYSYVMARKFALEQEFLNTNGDQKCMFTSTSSSDTLQSLDLAPPTRRLMRMKESGIVEKLFHLPGCAFMKAKPLVRLYQSHLVMRAHVEEDVVKADEIRRELEMSETIDDDIPCGIVWYFKICFLLANLELTHFNI
ncbi:Rad21 / Rec8 like protein [Dictyocaulus viviparus]|uniref:Rad21 / Rec8 like protein n=1 Tax=Dictyocaulus viviparus TaxID=29172 RepID=A0A0D8X8U8_DICVI|nr:Rad21 / Rec8 like protein [Dictyocaulus viviparus]